MHLERVKAMMMIIVCCCCGVSGFGEFEPPAPPPPPFHCHLIGYQKEKLRSQSKRLCVAEKVNQRGREQRIQVDNSRARSHEKLESGFPPSHSLQLFPNHPGRSRHLKSSSQGSRIAQTLPRVHCRTESEKRERNSTTVGTLVK